MDSPVCFASNRHPWIAFRSRLAVACLGTLTFLMAASVQAETALPAAVDWRHAVASTAFEQGADGEWVSTQVTAPFPFEELIYSWQLDRAGDTFRLFLQVTFESGEESDWLYAGYWGAVSNLTVLREIPMFERGELDMDWLKLTTKATAFRFKVVPSGGQIPAAPPSLTVIATDNHPSADIAERFRTAPKEPAPEPRVLDVPLRRQFDSDRERVIDACQSAALASALEYFGKSLPLEQIVRYTYDVEYQYPGIWPRLSGAAQELGFESFIERFRTWSDVQQALAQNWVILCSIRVQEGQCIAAPYPSMGPHIVALCGMTDDGRVVITDSFLGKSGTGYLCQWLQEDFEAAWMKNKGGIGIVIKPPEGAGQSLVMDLPAFPADRHFPSGDDH